MSTLQLTNDHAVGNTADDRYNGQDDAARLVRVVEALAAAGGRTALGLCGPWGGGKSSVLNLATPQMETRGFVVVSTAAWQDSLAGPGGIAAGLCARMCEKLLGGQRAKIGDVFAKTVERISKSEAASGALGGAVGIAAATVLARTSATHRIREALEHSAQQRHGKPVIVIVDDVDRLDGAGLRELFATIHELDDNLPLIFVLALDPTEVAHLLERQLSVRNGMDYLEKMVNVLVPIAPPSPAVLVGEATRRLSGLFNQHGLVVDDFLFPQHCVEVLLPHLHTPRDLQRLVNRISVTVASAGETQLLPRPYLVVETLAVFDSVMHETLRSNREAATGLAPSLRLWEGKQAATWDTKLVEDAFGALLRDPRLGRWRLEVLGSVLPTLPIRFEGLAGRNDLVSREPHELANPEYFDRYFHLNATLHDVPDRDVAEAWRRFLQGEPWPACFGTDWEPLRELVWSKLLAHCDANQLSDVDARAALKRLEAAYQQHPNALLLDLSPELACRLYSRGRGFEELTAWYQSTILECDDIGWMLAFADRARRQVNRPGPLFTARRRLLELLRRTGDASSELRRILVEPELGVRVAWRLRGSSWLSRELLAYAASAASLPVAAKAQLVGLVLSLPDRPEAFELNETILAAWLDRVTQMFGPTAAAVLRAAATDDVLDQFDGAGQQFLGWVRGL